VLKPTVCRLGWCLNTQNDLLYAQVTVHRDKLRIKQPTRCIKYPTSILSYNSTCFGHLLCPSSGVIYCTLGNWYVSCRLCDRFLAESGWNKVKNIFGPKPRVFIRIQLRYTRIWYLFLCIQPDSARKRSHNLHKTYHLPSVQ